MRAQGLQPRSARASGLRQDPPAPSLSVVLLRLRVISLPRRTLALLAFVPLLAILGLGRSVVLCTAQGGHMRVELLGSACCDDERTATVPDAAPKGPTASHRDCGSCVDLPLLVELRDRSSSRDRAERPLPRPTSQTAVASSCRPPAPGSGRKGVPVIDGGPPLPPPHLRALATVVLRS